MKNPVTIKDSVMLGVLTVVVYDTVKTTYQYAKKKQVGTKVKNSLVKLVKRTKEIKEQEEIR